MKGEYKQIPLDRIKDPERPLREDLSPESVQDLVASIKKVGVIEPIVVRETKEGIELVAGHRRLMAAEIAGLTEIPCIVVKAEGMEVEVLRLHENIVRDKISPIDWANHLHHLKSQYNLESAKIAELLGMSEAWVSQHLQILDYPTPLVEALKADKISFSAARELAQIRDPQKRESYIGHAIRGGITPALAIRWRKEANREPIAPNSTPPADQGTPPTEPQPTHEPVCPICGEAIPPAEAVTLTVHNRCQPK